MGRQLPFSLHGCIVLLLTLFIAVSLQAAVSTLDSGQSIRVGLTTIGKPSSITIRCDRPFDVIGKIDEPPVTTVEGQEAVFMSEANGIGISVNGRSLGTSPAPLLVVSKEDGATFEIVQPKAKYSKYHGILEINGATTLSLVDQLPLDEYVRGVIPAEVPKSFHPEAQKALTVAIRTYALTSLGRHKSSGFDVCDTTDCQGFGGASRDADWVDKLVDVTRGQIITYKGTPIHAVYSTDCGGITQNNEDAGFGDKPWPYLRSVVDGPKTSGPERPGQGDSSSATPPDSGVGDPQSPTTAGPPCNDYCSACPTHAWSKTFTLDELDHGFGGVKAVKIGKLQSMEFSDYDCSGRVKTVIIKGDQGEYRMKAGRLRDLFGLKSTRMTLQVTEDGRYVINGTGFGHGVGLCAFGANGLAKAKPGVTYVDILKHYYAGVEIKSIGDLDLRR